MKKRKGLTFIEMIVVLMIMGIFIYIVYNVFDVTFKAYQYNRETAAKMAAQTNVDNFFEIFEKELMYSGSMHQVIKNIPEFNQNPLEILESTQTKVETQYALAEKIILTKKDKGKYESQTNIGANATENTYFALYASDFPATGTNIDIWTLAYNRIESPTMTAVVLVESAYPTPATYDITALEIALKNIDPIPSTYTYLSPLLYEPAIEKSLPIRLESGKDWYGEIISKNTITEKVTNGATSLVLTKYIPTIDSSYTITLMNNINYFEATETTDTYIATISYFIPNDKENREIIVSRRFINPN